MNLKEKLNILKQIITYAYNGKSPYITKWIIDWKCAKKFVALKFLQISFPFRQLQEIGSIAFSESQGMGIGSLTGETRDTWHEVQNPWSYKKSLNAWLLSSGLPLVGDTLEY